MGAAGRLAGVLAEEGELVAAGRLQPACASFFRPAAGRERARLLLLHGFTAGPWQWRWLAERWAALGFSAWAPRLPGHGGRTAAGEADPSGLPRLGEQGRYAETARQALAALVDEGDAGLPLVAMGLSLGGAMVCDLLMADALAGRRQIAAAGLVAPMLAAASWRQRRLLATVHLASRAGGRAAARFLDGLPYSWTAEASASRRLGVGDGVAAADGAPGAPAEELGEAAGAAAGGSPWRRPGHGTFSVGQLLTAVDYARQVHRRLRPLTVPCQLIVSDADRRVSTQAALHWLRRSRAPWGVWRFTARLAVPHAMLSPEENPDAASRAILVDLLAELAGGGTPRHGP